MGIVYLLLHKGGLCHVHLAQSVQLGDAVVPEAPASIFSGMALPIPVEKNV